MTDNSFPVRSLNTFDNAAYQAERRLARKKQMQHMQQAFRSEGRIGADSDDLNSVQSLPAAFGGGASSSRGGRRPSSQIRKARDLVTDLYSPDPTIKKNHKSHKLKSSPSPNGTTSLNSASSHHRRRMNFNLTAEHVNLAPRSRRNVEQAEEEEASLQAETLMEDVEIASRAGGDMHKDNGTFKEHASGSSATWLKLCCGLKNMGGCCMESSVACWAKQTRRQRILLIGLAICIPIVIIILAVILTQSGGGGSDSHQSKPSSGFYMETNSQNVPRMYASPLDINRHVTIRNLVLEGGVVALPTHLDTFGHYSNLALRWIVDYDPAQLPTTHEALLQRYALAALYFATLQINQDDNGNFHIQSNWIRGEDSWLSKQGICAWEGISCPPIKIGGTFTTTYNDNTAVMQVNLTQNNLQGVLPQQELSALENVNAMDLSQNQLGGSIPSVVGTLQDLTSLHLSNNVLTGFLPSELGRLRQLQNVQMGHNQLEGTIPNQIMFLTKLEYLGLDNNYLSGALPDISLLDELIELYLDHNYLEGDLPDNLFQLSHMQDLRLSDNYLTGSIPSDVFKMSHLEYMMLGNNDLSGNIPNLFEETTRLRHVQLHKNSFTGPIPPTLGDCPVLQVLYLDNNYLTGSLPDQLGLLDDLILLYAYDNDLSGELPSQLTAMKNLRDLRLYNNALNGPLLDGMDSIFQLQILYLQNNQMNGTIPPSIGGLDHLQSIRLYQNQFVGTMPPDVCDLRQGHLKFLASDCNVAKGGKVDCDCCHECWP